jgi:hypothetical protein
LGRTVTVFIQVDFKKLQVCYTDSFFYSIQEGTLFVLTPGSVLERVCILGPELDTSYSYIYTFQEVLLVYLFPIWSA